MDMSEHPALDIALSLWIDWMKADGSEIRNALWYPAESVGLRGGWNRGDHGWEDLQDSLESKIVIIVNRAVGDLSPAHRAALEASVGLLSVCRVRNPEEMAQEARDRVWRALRAEGLS